MAKTVPIIRKTALLDEWVIITRYTQRDDHILAHIKYPIPPKDIEHIANDYLISQLKDCKKGYTYKTGNEEEGTLCIVTVERIIETTVQDCLECKRYNNLPECCFDYPDNSIIEAQQKCTVHNKEDSHGTE